MKDQNGVDYSGEFRALFVDKDGNRQLPSVRDFRLCLRDYLSDLFYELSNSRVFVEGIELYYDELRRCEEIGQNISAHNVLLMFCEEYSRWARIASDGGVCNYNSKPTNSVKNPLITANLLQTVLRDLNDFGSLRNDDDLLSEAYAYKDFHYVSVVLDSIVPEVCLEKADKNWSTVDKSNLIEAAGFITIFLNDNLPDWVVGRDTKQEAA